MQPRMFAVKTWGRMRSETACGRSRFVRPQGGCGRSAVCSTLPKTVEHVKWSRGRPMSSESNPTAQLRTTRAKPRRVVV